MASNDNLVNIQAATQAAQVANLAAQLEFSKQRFQLLELPEWQAASQMDIDKFAWQKAQDTYENAFKEASLTGTYQGQPTTEWLTQIAQMTGVLNGQQTLQGAMNDAQIAQINATIMNTNRGMDLQYAQYNTGREQWDAQHQMDLEKQQATLTGYVNGQPTFEREQWQASQGQAYLSLLGSLRGPENAFAQLKVLRNTPDALRQMAQSWAGQFASPGTTAGGGNPTPVTPQNMATPGLTPNGLSTAAPVSPAPGVVGYTPPGAPATQVPGSVASTVDPLTGAPIPGATKMIGDTPPVSPDVAASGVVGYTPTPPPHTVSPPGAPAPIQAYNYQADVTGGTQVYPPGTPAPVDATQISSYVPLNSQMQTALTQQATPGMPSPAPPAPAGLPVGATPAGTTGVTTPASLVAPGQINAREYNKGTDYEKSLGWASYEDAGWDKAAAQQVFQKSLPKYGVTSGATGSIKL